MPSPTLSSLYKPVEVEQKWVPIWWDQNVLFKGNVNSDKPIFSMVIPPPNITGSLHMGHALNNTIQDILIRWRHMSGDSTCWFPGTDHAGIATQVVVERQLKKEGKTRHQIGRIEFLKRVWKWKNEYGGIIDGQLKKLGVSCDWSRYSFTMDEVRASAVREAFVMLYKKGFIYRDEYIVNWCPQCQTALSDLEVEHSETENQNIIYYFRYRLEQPIEGQEFIMIATRRPETILGDVAIAVHPEDSRYKKLVGKNAILPLVGSRLKIIADELADPSVGTGAVKITPAHDPNDFQMGRRHDLPIIKVIDLQGKVTTTALNAPQVKKYDGLDRFECRDVIIQDLKEAGAFIKAEPWSGTIGRCARCSTIIEPAVSLQWFMKMDSLAKPAIEAVKNKKVQFHPERFAKLYLDWMENIRDWCISRQLWWGHQIPAWYCSKCGSDHPIVAIDKPTECPNCHGKNLTQEPDVLDTWFSAALWPLSVMGWPEETKDLRTYYPTSVLSTGRDIIFLWVSRMIMMGLEFRHEIPFHHVSIHPTILDREGRRMSKSKGTGVDPLDLIEKYGADATRFGTILMAQAQDVRFNEEKIELARNFTNKIWNAARFIASHLPENFLESNPSEKIKPVTFYDEWILSKLSDLIQSVTKNLQAYEFSKAAALLYDFFWEYFCDWYLELCKSRLQGNTQSAKSEVLFILTKILRDSLKLMHPFMPFLTEEIWQQFSGKPEFLFNLSWPTPFKVAHRDSSMGIFMETITGIRNLRAELNLKPKDQAPLIIKTENPTLFEKMKAELMALGQISDLKIGSGKSPASQKAFSLQTTYGSLYLPLEGVVDISNELARLKQEQNRIRQELESVNHRLNDLNFIQKAKPEIVAGAKEKAKQLQDKAVRLKERIAMLEPIAAP